MSEFADLLSFLQSDRVDVQEEALKVLLHILQPENSSYFNTNEIILLLLNQMKVPSLSLYVMNVFNVMITHGIEKLLHADQIIALLVTYLLTSTNPTIINISLVLLTNLTISLENTEILAEKVLANPLIFNQFLDRFLAHNPQAESSEPSASVDESGEVETIAEIDSWQYFGSVLCNLCQKEKIQLHLLSKSSNYLSSLTKQVRPPLFPSSLSQLSSDSLQESCAEERCCWKHTELFVQH
jgi:hypothetical protein